MSKTGSKAANTTQPSKEGTAPEVAVNEELLKAGQSGYENLKFEEIDNEDLGALMAGKAPMDKAGFRIRAELVGVRRIFSDKFVKTGKTMTYNGKQHLYRDKIELLDASGRLFAIWGTGFLTQEIGKLPRHSAVEITYNGKEIKETARGPQESHDFTVRYAGVFVVENNKKIVKAQAYDKYAKGIQNWLSSPVPASEDSDTSSDLVNFMNYERDVRAGLVAGQINENKLLAQ